MGIQELRNILVFLKRSHLTGEEVYEYIRIVTLIEQEIIQKEKEVEGGK